METERRDQDVEPEVQPNPEQGTTEADMPDQDDKRTDTQNR